MTTRPLHLEDIPDELRAEDRWVLWRFEDRNGRTSKVPYQATGRRAKSDEAATWARFGVVADAFDRGDFSGVGFVLGDGWAGIDLDHCRKKSAGWHAPASVPVLERLANLGVYIEVSPSGTGYKAIGRAARIGGQIDYKPEAPAVTPWSGARYFAVTGHHRGDGSPTTDITALLDEWFPITSLPTRVRDAESAPAWVKRGDKRGTELIALPTDDELVDRILASPQALKFAGLIRGEIADYGNDRSRADQALVNILVWWSRGNVEQVDRIFRESNLMRPKWQGSYRRATLNKALAAVEAERPR